METKGRVRKVATTTSEGASCEIVRDLSHRHIMVEVWMRGGGCQVTVLKCSRRQGVT
jgi:hypothetical protein